MKSIFRPSSAIDSIISLHLAPHPFLVVGWRCVRELKHSCVHLWISFFFFSLLHVKKVLWLINENFSLSLQIGNQNTPRIASRLDDSTEKYRLRLIIVYALQLLLPGTPFNYYGDEFGQRNGQVSTGDVSTCYFVWAIVLMDKHGWLEVFCIEISCECPVNFCEATVLSCSGVPCHSEL